MILCPDKLGEEEMINFKIGILGTGTIAEKIAETIAKLDAFEVYAVGSRDAEKAAIFAEKFNITKSYGSYDELVNDPEVELVYVATPNQCHADNAVLAINAGKPVLVEKPFSYNNKTTQDVIALAREKQVFCAEANWLRFSPLLKEAYKITEAKELGDIRLITANLGYDLRMRERLIKADFAGGALLDLGIYPLTAVFTFMNSLPAAVSSATVRLSTGVDALDTIQMNFPNGKAASVLLSMVNQTDNRLTIYGTEGRLEIDNIVHPEEVRVYNFKNEMTKKINLSDKEISGYEYEFIAARDAIIIGKPELPDVTHKDTISLLNFTDMLRRAWQIFYPLPGEETLKNAPNPATQVPPIPRDVPNNNTKNV